MFQQLPHTGDQAPPVNALACINAASTRSTEVRAPAVEGERKKARNAWQVVENLVHPVEHAATGTVDGTNPA